MPPKEPPYCCAPGRWLFPPRKALELEYMVREASTGNKLDNFTVVVPEIAGGAWDAPGVGRCGAGDDDELEKE